jgi:D-beta-D-heptose 7-phosphate kinase/D-beta-D-heptose 1-phosphate adenosyltransferase
LKDKTVVLVTGGFDPLHSGHIEYFKAARALGDKLVVGVNSDEWLTRKKGKPFMCFKERATIIQALECVDQVIDFDDSDDSACGAIYKTMATHSNVKIIVANGGDRSNTNTLEYATYGDLAGVEFAWGVGGTDKKNSSSWLLDDWRTQKTERDWGYWRVLDDKGTVKVKELVINPGCSLSDQKHELRCEHWYVLQGEVWIDLEFPDGQWQIQGLTQHTNHVINSGIWHKARNPGSEPAHVLEVQWGERCVEEDIVRR